MEVSGNPLFLLRERGKIPANENDDYSTSKNELAVGSNEVI